VNSDILKLLPVISSDTLIGLLKLVKKISKQTNELIFLKKEEVEELLQQINDA
jgi:hypothetical protein